MKWLPILYILVVYKDDATNDITKLDAIQCTPGEVYDGYTVKNELKNIKHYLNNNNNGNPSKIFSMRIFN